MSLELHQEQDQSPSSLSCAIPECTSRLETLACGSEGGLPCDEVIDALRRDDVALIQRVASQDHADAVIAAIATGLGLLEQLRVQATFASVHGHRRNIGRHFMSVNQRGDYQFIPPHSEGDRKANIQLGALYCHQNSTDGGSTVLMNTDPAGAAWAKLRELVVKVDLGGRQLSRGELTRLKMMHGVTVPDDQLNGSDRIVSQLPSAVPGVRMFHVLAPLKLSRSRILNREMNVYWDNIASVDFDSGSEYLRLLEGCGLLKVPPAGPDIAVLDGASIKRTWSSGVVYGELFRARITRKLDPGELVVFNNFSWTHSTSNWTPGSGKRDVAVAFA